MDALPQPRIHLGPANQPGGFPPISISLSGVFAIDIAQIVLPATG